MTLKQEQNNVSFKGRGKIDTFSNRLNRINRGDNTNIEVIREGFECLRCGHRKGFFKRYLGKYECTRCKNVQKDKHW